MRKLVLLLSSILISNLAIAQGIFTVPPLPYPYKTLEPYIDEETMIIHHDKHHEAYVKKLNEEVAADTRLKNMSVEQICKNVSMYNTSVRNNAGGHYNHSLFWTVLSPHGGEPSAMLLDEINKTYGSLDKFKMQFSDSAKTRFGSGWAWLIVSPNSTLKITTTSNQDNPLMDIVKENGTPILALDVWEHAYYLKYHNKRPDYITAFWSVVNWAEVNKRYNEARSTIADQEASNKKTNASGKKNDTVKKNKSK